MRTRVMIGGVLASAAVIIGGWEAGQTQTPSTTAATAPVTGTPEAGTPDAGTPDAGTPDAGRPGAGTGSPTSTGRYKDGTYTGSTSSTRFGTVQVQVSVSGGSITQVTPVQLTSRDRRSARINEQAAPILQQEVLAAQSAHIDTVSGATYTSDGYLQSLQAALDRAAQ